MGLTEFVYDDKSFGARGLFSFCITRFYSLFSRLIAYFRFIFDNQTLLFDRKFLHENYGKR